MAEREKEFREAGTEIVALVRSTKEQARAYFEEHRIPFPCLVNPRHGVYDQYEVESRLLSLGQRPALFVIDREGIVGYAYLGWQQWEIPPNAEVLEVCRGLSCGVAAAA